MTDRKALRQRFEELARCTEDGQYATIGAEDVRGVLEIIRDVEPRVLTPREFDEVRLSKPVWLEVRNMDLLEPALFRYQRPEYGKVAFSLIENRAIERDVTEYYWGWRCWSAEPSDELRRKTMWAMMDEMYEALRRDDEIASGVGQAFSPDPGDEVRKETKWDD